MWHIYVIIPHLEGKVDHLKPFSCRDSTLLPQSRLVFVCHVSFYTVCLHSGSKRRRVVTHCYFEICVVVFVKVFHRPPPVNLNMSADCFLIRWKDRGKWHCCRGQTLLFLQKCDVKSVGQTVGQTRWQTGWQTGWQTLSTFNSVFFLK